MKQLENFNIINEFKEECKVIDLRWEYGLEYTGKEQYGIITALNEDELIKKYETLLIDYEPYILLPLGFNEIRRDYMNNENKFYMRRVRGQECLLGLDYAYSQLKLASKMFNKSEEVYIDRERLKKILDCLSTEQRRRFIAVCINGYQIKDLARLEGVSVAAVYKSLDKVYKVFKREI